MNVTEYVNTTVNVTTTYNVSTHQPLDVVLALDASRSVTRSRESTRWRLHETTSFNAGRSRTRTLSRRTAPAASCCRASSTDRALPGVAVWAVDGVSRRDLTSIANATDVDQMEDVARLPYCAPSRRPIRSRPSTYSNYFCVGDPSATRSSNEFELAGVDVAANMSSTQAGQDEDHAYDLRHDASQVWGLTTGTYYAQALLRCHDALIPQNDAFGLRRGPTARSTKIGTRNVSMTYVNRR